MLSPGRQVVVRRSCQAALLGSLAMLASLFWIMGVALLTESQVLMRIGVYVFIPAVVITGCSVVALAVVIVPYSIRRSSPHSTGRP